MPGIPPFIPPQPDLPSAQMSPLEEGAEELCSPQGAQKTSSQAHRQPAYRGSEKFFTKSLFNNRFVIPLLGLIFIASLCMGFFSRRISSNHIHLTYLKGPCPDFIGRQRYLDVLY